MDASALVELLFRAGRQDAVERLFRTVDSELHVPALCDIEVAAAVRRAVRRRFITLYHAAQAIEGYLHLPLSRHGHQWLIMRILDLRENFSAYDATYVALAEELGAPLVTGDESLAHATRTHSGLETILV